MTHGFMKQGNLETDTQGEFHVNMKAEIGVMFLLAEVSQKITSKLPESREEARNGFSLTVAERTKPAKSPDLGPLTSRTVSHYIAIV